MAYKVQLRNGNLLHVQLYWNYTKLRSNSWTMEEEKEESPDYNKNSDETFSAPLTIPEIAQDVTKHVRDEIGALTHDVRTDLPPKTRRRSTLKAYVEKQEQKQQQQQQGRLSHGSAAITTKGGGSYANLSEEIGDHLMTAITIYGFAEIRASLRSGQVEFSEEARAAVFTLPARRKQLIQILLDHEELLRAARLDTDIYRVVLENFDTKSVQEVRSRRASLLANDEISLLVFDDENNTKELVYGIGVDRMRKDIRVTFRGSANAHDWAVNLDHFMILKPNPLYGKKAAIPQSKHLGFHRGFYYSLMGTTATQPESKFQVIWGHLRRIQEEYPGFHIQVTGHSLGGALATLFAFMLACEDEAPVPVRVITFGSPRFSNVHFARAFQELELQGRLYHLRVLNDRDLVTTVPDRLSCLTFWMQDGIFRHVGVELRLYSDGERKPQFHFPLFHFSRVRLLMEDASISMRHSLSKIKDLTCGCCLEDYAKWHSCQEYMNRILREGSEMEHLTLDVIHHIYVGKINQTSE